MCVRIVKQATDMLAVMTKCTSGSAETASETDDGHSVENFMLYSFAHHTCSLHLQRHLPMYTRSTEGASFLCEKLRCWRPAVFVFEVEDEEVTVVVL